MLNTNFAKPLPVELYSSTKFKSYSVSFGNHLLANASLEMACLGLCAHESRLAAEHRALVLARLCRWPPVFQNCCVPEKPGVRSGAAASGCSLLGCCVVCSDSRAPQPVIRIPA